jgi:putative membrane protein
VHLTEVVIAGLLGGVWIAYALGARRRRPSTAQAITFHSTAVLAVLALLGPLDHWARTGTTAHMSQHMVLIVAIAPLWVLSRPLAQLVAGAGPWIGRAAVPLLRFSARPMTAALVHGAAIWLWHLPMLYEAAIMSPAWHLVAHASFLLTAGVFWWAVLSSPVRRAGWALFALLFTLMHTGFLGALLTFARTPLYTDAQGMTDQQLAGLVMWVLAGLPYVAAAGWCAWRWQAVMLRRH